MKKSKALTRSQIIKRLDALTSMYVRYGGAWLVDGVFVNRCVSCGKVYPVTAIDAGHFIARECIQLRFDFSNVHCECKNCNAWDEHHMIGYRDFIIRAHGGDVLTRLMDIKQKRGTGELKAVKMQELRELYNERLGPARAVQDLVQPIVQWKSPPIKPSWKIEERP